LIREAVCYDEQQAYTEKTPLINYDKAIMYSLSQTGRMINPDILTGILTWPRKMLETQRITDQIWEHACLELDHECFVIKGQLTSTCLKKPEIDCRTKWSMKLRELVYATHNSRLTQVAFAHINWLFKEETFQNLNKKDPYALLYSNNQKEVWQKACSLREKPKKPKALPEPPAEVLRREWQKALVDIANDHEKKPKNSAKHNPIDYKKVVINAFKRIAWNVPKQAFDCLQPYIHKRAHGTYISMSFLVRWL